MFQSNFDFRSLRDDPRFATMTARAGSTPGWVFRYAALAAIAVVVVPIVLVFGAALLTFVLVFLLLSLIHRVGGWFEGSFGGNGSRTADTPARRNVRVVGPD